MKLTIKEVNGFILEIKLIGKQLADRINDARKELFPNDSCHENRWLTAYDRVEVNGDLCIEYWENGRYGGTDECIHYIEMTDDLFTEEGQQRYIDNWVNNFREHLAKESVKKEAEKLRRKKQLEEELRKLGEA